MLLQTLEKFFMVLASGPDNPEALEVLRQVYAQVRLAHEEGSIYHVASALGLGNWLHQHGLVDEAEPYFREAIRYMEGNPDAHQFYRAVALDRLLQIIRNRTDPESVAETDALLETLIGYLRDRWSPAELAGNLVYLADRLGSRNLFARALEPATEVVQMLRDKELDERILARVGDEVAELVLRIALTPELDTEVYEGGLRAIEGLLELLPDDTAYAVARGAILYRLERIDEAYELYSGIETAGNPRYDIVAPVKAAFHALTAHRLGRAEEVDTHFARMLEVASGPHRLDQETVQTLITEVRSTLGRE